ncbi:hypothetical protein [Palleronia sp.]|uniref:hypothetical protein n=1 Tax=Palleronia sp. TaxID=1940284 RepID=UPI0035C85866
MDNLLASQLGLLESQLKSLSGEWRIIVRSAFDTMSSDTDSLKQAIGQRMQALLRQTEETGDQLENRIKRLEAQSRKLSQLIATRGLTTFLAGAVLATVMSFGGAFLAVTMMINGQQQVTTPQPPVPSALQGSRSVRGPGGLGQVTLLPPNVNVVHCPIGNGSGRICIQRVEE